MTGAGVAAGGSPPSGWRPDSGAAAGVRGGGAGGGQAGRQAGRQTASGAIEGCRGAAVCVVCVVSVRRGTAQALNRGARAQNRTSLRTVRVAQSRHRVSRCISQLVPNLGVRGRDRRPPARRFDDWLSARRPSSRRSLHATHTNLRQQLGSWPGAYRDSPLRPSPAQRSARGRPAGQAGAVEVGDGARLVLCLRRRPRRR